MASRGSEIGDALGTSWFCRNPGNGPGVTLDAETRSAAWQRIPALRAGRVGSIERDISNVGGPGSALRLSDRITDLILRAPAAG